jgi:hypothetical protein
MKKIMDEFGDIIIGVLIFGFLVLGVAGTTSFKTEITRIGTSGITQVQTVK